MPSLPSNCAIWFASLESGSAKFFSCKVCKSPVRPMVESSVRKAHFEHFARNIDCPLSDKRTIHSAYSAYKVARNS